MKFQKVRLNWKVVIDYDWMLVIENMDEFNYYFNKSMEAQIPITWKNLGEVSKGKAHISTVLGQMINMASEADGKMSLLELTAIVGGKIYSAKAQALLNTGKIYVNKNGGFFPHSEDIEVLEEMEIKSKDVIFPSYSNKDIVVKQWEGGNHWYAYVGNF